MIVQAGDSSPEELANAVQHTGAVLPIASEVPTVPLVAVTSEMTAFNAYQKLRFERAEKKLEGIRKKKAAEKEKEEKK